MFEETLQRFSQTLEKHDVAKKIDIALKKPNEYSMKDVVQIADKVYEKHKTASDVKSCTGAIRKCFRFTGKNASPLQCLLNFVPSDTYGSVISGGFTVILAVSLFLEIGCSHPKKRRVHRYNKLCLLRIIYTLTRHLWLIHIPIWVWVYLVQVY